MEEQKDSKNQPKVEIQNNGMVKVLGVEIRQKIRKEVPFVKGAWIELFDDISVADEKRLKMVDWKGEPPKQQEETEEGYNIRKKAISEEHEKIATEILLKLIADWNFADDNGIKLVVTREIFENLPLKLRKWLIKQANNIVSDIAEHEQVKKN